MSCDPRNLTEPTANHDPQPTIHDQKVNSTDRQLAGFRQKLRVCVLACRRVALLACPVTSELSNCSCDLASRLFAYSEGAESLLTPEGLCMPVGRLREPRIPDLLHNPLPVSTNSGFQFGIHPFVLDQELWIFFWHVKSL